MITKVFFTIFVIIVVGMIFHNRTTQTQAAAKRATAKNEPASLSPRALAYILIGVLVLISVSVFFYNWSASKQIVTLRILDANGGTTEYQAYKKDLKNRAFDTIDGTHIELANSDRLELIQ